MAEQGLFIITDTSAVHSLAKYAAKEALRGKGLMETARKIFAFLVSFALGTLPGGGRKIPEGNKTEIRNDLMRVVTAYKRLSAWSGASSSLRTRRVRRAQDELRGTLAAKVVWILNYHGARAVKGPAFYKLVRKFVSGRVYAANLHRAGLLPAMSGSKARRPGSPLPKFRHTPGSYAESLTEDVATILCENWASAHGPKAKGIVGLAGYAFDQSLPEVDRLLTSYLQQEMVKNARAAGFHVPVSS